jgi:hypothetical protein
VAFQPRIAERRKGGFSAALATQSSARFANSEGAGYFSAISPF